MTISAPPVPKAHQPLNDLCRCSPSSRRLSFNYLALLKRLWQETATRGALEGRGAVAEVYAAAAAMPDHQQDRYESNDSNRTPYLVMKAGSEQVIDN